MNRSDFFPNDEEIAAINTIFDSNFKIPNNFSPTAEPFKPRPYYNRGARQPEAQLNPQTTSFCAKLGIDDPLEKLIGKPVPTTAVVVNPDEIDLEDDVENEDNTETHNAAAVDGNDIFFVDTQPQKRNKMSLPQPQNAVEEEQEIEKEHPISPPDENQPCDKETGDDAPTVKKLRRRNQDLYTAKEDSN